MNTKSAPPSCETCAVFGQACCKRHQYRRSSCKLVCGTHPAFEAADDPAHAGDGKEQG
jgi:hypothetical protein